MDSYEVSCEKNCILFPFVKQDRVKPDSDVKSATGASNLCQCHCVICCEHIPSAWQHLFMCCGWGQERVCYHTWSVNLLDPTTQVAAAQHSSSKKTASPGRLSVFNHSNHCHLHHQYHHYRCKYHKQLSLCLFIAFTSKLPGLLLS